MGALDLEALLDRLDGHRGLLRQQLGEQTLVRRIKVLDNDVSGVALRRQCLQEFGQGFEAAGRGADRDQGERHQLGASPLSTDSHSFE